MLQNFTLNTKLIIDIKIYLISPLRCYAHRPLVGTQYPQGARGCGKRRASNKFRMTNKFSFYVYYPPMALRATSPARGAEEAKAIKFLTLLLNKIRHAELGSASFML